MRDKRNKSRGNRRQSRRVLLQALYQWSMADSGYEEMRQLYADEGSLQHADVDYFRQCLSGVMSQVKDIDRTYAPYLDRELEELTELERACLRVGTFELLESEAVPPAVIINEWVELAKKFGAENSFRYVNAVLDAVARTVREPVL